MTRRYTVFDSSTWYIAYSMQHAAYSVSPHLLTHSLTHPLNHSFVSPPFQGISHTTELQRPSRPTKGPSPQLVSLPKKNHSPNSFQQSFYNRLEYPASGWSILICIGAASNLPAASFFENAWKYSVLPCAARAALSLYLIRFDTRPPRNQHFLCRSGQLK